MNTLKLRSIPDFKQQLRAEIDELLHARGIYRLESYGWIDADTYDPDLIGHAMNQTDSLSFRYFLAAMDAPDAPYLTEWQKSLIIAGGDFEGLMEAVRLSIGLLLFEDSLPPTNTNRSAFLSLHLMSAMFLLGAASDRIWDFFVLAVFKKPRERPRQSPTKDYYAKGKFENRERSKYSTAFHEASRLTGKTNDISDSLTELPNITEKIELFRESRNGIVHRIATEQGQQELRLVNDPPSNDGTDHVDWTPPSEEVIREMRYQEETEHQKRIAEPIDWYKTLIEASNHVFIIENGLRKRC